MRAAPNIFAIPALALLWLSGCATSTATSVADVTRFHLGQPVPKDTVTVLIPPGASLQDQTHAATIAAELARLGFTPIPENGNSAYIATWKLETNSRQGPPRPAKFTLGIGGGTFGRNVGISGGTSIPIGGERPGATVTTSFMTLDLRRRSDGSVVWEGRATRDTAEQVGNPVPGLVKALLADFPGPSGQMVQVRIPS